MFFALTDFHDDLLSLPTIISSNINFILIGGDFTNFGEYNRDSLTRLNDLNIPIYFIYGNHEDGLIDCEFIENNFSSFKYIGNKVEKIKINNIEYTIIGIDGSNELSPDEKFEDDELFEYYFQLLELQNVKKDNSILVTHFQPEKLFFNDRYGSKTVRKIYNFLKPIITICGHRHDLFFKYDKVNRICNPGNKGMLFKSENSIFSPLSVTR